jgi:hypothetical protein
VDAAAAAYPTSGYIACEGLERCRGALAAVYEPADAKASADGPNGWAPSWFHELPPPVTAANGHHQLAAAR